MNKAELIKELKNIGLEEGMEIEVHSSLSSFGYVEGGAETVIEALMECVTEQGSIFMPSLCFGPELELTEEDKQQYLWFAARVGALRLLADAMQYWKAPIGPFRLLH